jgi:hypothetical protein
MDYNLQIPNIYENAYSSYNKDYILEIVEIDLKNLYEKTREYISTHKTLFILIKTNIYFNGLHISDIEIYNNLIYFPDENISVLKMFNHFYDIDIDLDQYFLKLYIIKYDNNTVCKKFVSLNHYDYNTYCTGDEDMLIFHQKENIMTFTIHIHLYDKNIKSYIKFDKIKLKFIKFKSNNLIFIYNPMIINDRNIVLYLIEIKKIDSGESLIIDIKFNNIDSIYDKYKNYIDLVKKFMSFKNFSEYYIEMKYLEKYIKGVYYPYTFCIK